MGKTFKNFKEIHIYLQKQIDDSLKTDVAEYVKDELQTGIDDAVYSAGDPIQYKRRYYSGGGLGDRETMKSKLIKSGELTVTPESERSGAGGRGYEIDQSLSYNIIKGYGDKSQWWNEPRDFIEQTKDNIKSDNTLVEVMKDSLMGKGFDVV